MKVVVTGATGFIGQHVLKELTKYSVDVIAISRHPFFEQQSSSRITYIQMDLHKIPKNLSKIIGKPDILIHLAWGGLPNYNSLHHFEVELPMHYRFLKKFVTLGVTGITVAGTCFEYGFQSGELTEQLPTIPNNCYGYAKDSLHSQLMYLQTHLSFSLTWGRLFYMYGEGQAQNSLYSSLHKAVERGDTVFNMSGGEQIRDYSSVANVAKYIVIIALQKRNIGAINICSGKPISVHKLVENWIIKNNWSISLNLGHYPYSDFEPMSFWGNRKKLDKYMEL